jgi:hypothetical protein
MVEQLTDQLLSPAAIQRMLDQLDGAATRWVKDRAARRTALMLELRAVEEGGPSSRK